MAKRFFWLKMKEDFFDEKYVKALRRLPQGDSLVVVYLKMQLKSLKTEGIIKYEGILPDSTAELAMALDEDENVVKLALSALISYGVVERWDDETLYMSAMQQLIGSESESAARVRRHRALQSNGDRLLGNGDVTDCNTEKEKEIEIEPEIEPEIEKEKEKEKEKATARQSDGRVSRSVIDQEFNRLWELYPRKQGKANALKAYTKARKEDSAIFSKIEAGIEAYKAYIKANRIDLKYIKQGSTWFNQRAWEDDYASTASVGKGNVPDKYRVDKDYSAGFEYEE